MLRKLYAVDDSPEPESFITVSHHPHIRVLDRDTWQETWAWNKFETNVIEDAVYGYGIVVAVTREHLEWVKIADISKNKKLTKVNAPGLAREMETGGVMQNGTQIAVGSKHKLGLIDLETGRAIRSVETNPNDGRPNPAPSSITAVPGHPGLVIHMDGSGKAAVWDLNASNKDPIKVILGVEKNPMAPKFNPTNPNEFVCLSLDQVVKVYDFNRGRAIHTLDISKTHNPRAVSIYGNAVLQAVATGSGDMGVINLLDNNDVNEDVAQFSVHDRLEACYLTASSAIVAGGGIVDYKLASQ